MIPNTFHFIFGLKPTPQKLHLVHYICLRSCMEVNKPDKIYFYYEQEPYGKYWEKIREHLCLVKVSPQKVINGKKLGYAHQSDFIRLEMLNRHGGIYADMDSIFVEKIPQAMREKPFVMGLEDLSDSFAGLGNAIIMAEAQSLFGTIWEKNIVKEFDGSWNNHSILYPLRLSKEFPDAIKIEPQKSFYKHIWSEEGLKNIFVNVDNDLDGVYSLHLWEHLCWHEYIEKINEDYIREVDSTYNVLARKYI